jgi:outer membrane protein TolC
VTAERDTQLKATHEAEQANVQLKASADEREAQLKAVTAERDALKAAVQPLAQ